MHVHPHVTGALYHATLALNAVARFDYAEAEVQRRHAKALVREYRAACLGVVAWLGGKRL